MSIATEITRISGLRDKIRSKLLDFGIITSDSANLSDCATAIDGINKVTPSIPSATITINTAPTLNKSTGVITMSASKSASVTPTVSKGYTDGSGTAGTITAKVSSTLQLSPTLAAKTYTPGTSNQTIAAQRWLTGAQTIAGDSNLVAGNIKSGVKIFGVTGTASGTVNIITGTATATLNSNTFNTALDGSSTYSQNSLSVSVSDLSKIVGFVFYASAVHRHTKLAGIVTYNNIRYGKVHVNDYINGTQLFYYIPLNSGTTLTVPIRYATSGGVTYNYYILTT